MRARVYVRARAAVYVVGAGWRGRGLRTEADGVVGAGDRGDGAGGAVGVGRAQLRGRAKEAVEERARLPRGPRKDTKLRELGEPAAVPKGP